MTTLTRKHFECIAAHLRRRQPEMGNMKLGYHLAISAVANALQEINPRFDRTRFVRACCPPGEEVPPQDALDELTAVG